MGLLVARLIRSAKAEALRLRLPVQAVRERAARAVLRVAASTTQ
jgi:hypothetical protein